MQISAQAHPPQILQIHRDRLKPGSNASYGNVEEHAARLCAELGCPHPYLAIESLTGSKEVWFLNGYGSPAEQKQVADDYTKSGPLIRALEENGRRKVELTLEAVNAFAEYRRDLSRGVPWSVGRGCFLVITVTEGSRGIEGTVFETAEGTKFIVMPAETHEEADAMAAAVGPEANIFAVRPSWSFPARERIAADPVFWQQRSASRAG